MKRIRKNMLSQEMKETKQDGVTKEFDVKQVKGKHQCHIIQNICGEIKLAGAPYFSLVLDNESDIIPLISVDSPHHLVDWMSFVGQNVMIKELVIISESFQKYNSSTEHKNYLVKRENVILLGNKDIESRNKKNILEIDRSNVKEKKRNNIIGSQRTCRIVVHHVSTPFHITEDTSYYCLALISYTNNNNLVVIIWLVLREEQVAWREFMVPNREYLLHFPPETDKFFFDSAKKPLDTIMEKNIREIRVMFHHKMLFSRHGMLNGSIVPPGSKLYLSQNTSLSECIYRFTVDLLWFRHWFSTSEADHASVPLVTFYGKVTSIKYLEEEVYQSCYLCIHKNPREPVLRSPKTFHNKVWIDPFQSGLVIEEEQLIELPSVTNIEKSRMKTGVPGELVQVITLEDLFTGEERSVYIKHSFVSNYQQMVRLAAGVTVCISHLSRRCSKTGKYYYLATMLSCCRVLDYTICSDYNEGWGMYGLCHKKGDDQAKMWGVVEPFSITKVGIRAKCNYCRALFFKGNCSNSCGGIGTYSTSAHAIAWINVIQENKRITKEKVIIKDDLVRKLLNIPEEYWEVLQEMAALEEIVAFRYQALNDESDISPLRKSFQRYCFVKSREKFYISMKKLPNQDEGRLYFCLSLEPVNKERLDLVAGLVELST